MPISPQQQTLIKSEIKRLFHLNMNYFYNHIDVKTIYEINFTDNGKWILKCKLSDNIISTDILKNDLNKIDADIKYYESAYLPDIDRLNLMNHNRFKVLDDIFIIKYSINQIDNRKIDIEILTARLKPLFNIPNTILNNSTVDIILLKIAIFINKKEAKKLRGPVHPIDALSNYLNENGIQTKVKLKFIVHRNRFIYIHIKYNTKFIIGINGTKCTMMLEDPDTFSHIRDVIKHLVYDSQKFEGKMPPWKRR